MANLIIPVTDSPAFQQDLTLDGRVFSFLFVWNSNFLFWSLSIFDRDSNPIILGIKLVLNYELLKMHPTTLGPQGELYVIDLKEGPENISYADLVNNGRCQVLYVEPV